MTDGDEGTPRHRHRAYSALRWALVLAWASVIFAFSAQPGSNVPGRFASLAHFGEYAIFGVVLGLALAPGRSRARTVAYAVLLASLYAITDEAHQHFVPGRTPDVADWGMDTLGACAGALAHAVASRGGLGRRLLRGRRTYAA